MRLSFDQIKDCTFGAIEVTQREDGIHFKRCTDKQVAAWGEMHVDLGERATYPSGIQLDFHTNSKVLRFSAANGTMYDVCINGLLRRSVNMKTHREKGIPATIPLTDSIGGELDDVRVSIYFPRGNFPAVISYVELDDGAYVKPHVFDHKFLFYGDSITQGCSCVHHSLCYTYSVSQFFNAESLNQGVGGGRFDGSTYDDIDYEPDTVFISFGTNDFNHYKTLEEMEAQTCAFMDKVKERYKNIAKRFFVISPIWRADLAEKEREIGSFADARAVVIRQAQAHGMTHVDGLKLVPPLPCFFQDEYLHPNDAGFGLYTQNLIREIIRYF